MSFRSYRRDYCCFGKFCSHCSSSPPSLSILPSLLPVWVRHSSTIDVAWAGSERCFDSALNTPSPLWVIEWAVRRGGEEQHSCTHNLVGHCHVQFRRKNWEYSESFLFLVIFLSRKGLRDLRWAVISNLPFSFSSKSADLVSRHFGWTLFVYILQHIFGSHHRKSSASPKNDKQSFQFSQFSSILIKPLLNWLLVLH